MSSQKSMVDHIGYVFGNGIESFEPPDVLPTESNAIRLYMYTFDKICAQKPQGKYQKKEASKQAIKEVTNALIAIWNSLDLPTSSEMTVYSKIKRLIDRTEKIKKRSPRDRNRDDIIQKELEKFEKVCDLTKGEKKSPLKIAKPKSDHFKIDEGLIRSNRKRKAPTRDPDFVHPDQKNDLKNVDIGDDSDVDDGLKNVDFSNSDDDRTYKPYSDDEDGSKESKKAKPDPICELCNNFRLPSACSKKKDLWKRHLFYDHFKQKFEKDHGYRFIRDTKIPYHTPYNCPFEGCNSKSTQRQLWLRRRAIKIHFAFSHGIVQNYYQEALIEREKENYKLLHSDITEPSFEDSYMKFLHEKENHDESKDNMVSIEIFNFNENILYLSLAFFKILGQENSRRNSRERNKLRKRK